LDPKFAEPHCNLGMLYEVEQKVYQALISYKRAIEVDPNSPEIATFYNNLGMNSHNNL
jgi:cytochrome c-type biogenesis protein CcmH/NrfG